MGRPRSIDQTSPSIGVNQLSANTKPKSDSIPDHSEGREGDGFRYEGSGCGADRSDDEDDKVPSGNAPLAVSVNQERNYLVGSATFNGVDL